MNHGPDSERPIGLFLTAALPAITLGSALPLFYPPPAHRPRSLARQASIGTTSIGVGAIVGGGILALAGVAFAATGPSAVLAFALNGLIALLTALSFVELSAAFPQSGGTYTFATKVLSVDVAFAVGWVVWFASIAAGTLYSLGFSYFALTGRTVTKTYKTFFATYRPVGGVTRVVLFNIDRRWIAFSARTRKPPWRRSFRRLPTSHRSRGTSMTSMGCGAPAGKTHATFGRTGPCTI